jgi:hypothetical protein
MLRILSYFPRIANFDQLAKIHHPDPIADVSHNSQVMGNEQIGQLKLPLQFLKQINHLGLDGDIKRGDRFVTDDELGIEGKSSSDSDPLALAPGKFMGITIREVTIETDDLQEILDFRAPLGAPVHPEYVERFGDDAPNRHSWVE